MRQIFMQKTVQNTANLCAKKQCEMRQFSANFPAKSAVFLAYHSGKIWRIFQCFLQESLQKIVWQFPIFFKLFYDEFLWNCVQEWERRVDPGQNVAIPIGIALKKLVLAARNQRKAKLARKLENAVSDVIGGVGGE